LQLLSNVRIAYGANLIFTNRLGWGVRVDSIGLKLHLNSESILQSEENYWNSEERIIQDTSRAQNLPQQDLNQLSAISDPQHQNEDRSLDHLHRRCLTLELCLTALISSLREELNFHLGFISTCQGFC
jgi:hypothetical protein